MALLYLFVTLITVDSGLMYQVVSPAFDFSPEEETTRAMVVTILHRLEGRPEGPVGGFGDLTDDWYREAVGWAAGNGIVSGYGASRFGPNDQVTREQLVAILSNYAAHKGYDLTGRDLLSGYVDGGAVSSWARQAMEWAVGNGLVSGESADRLAPAGHAQRAQLAAILQRFLGKVSR